VNLFVDDAARTIFVRLASADDPIDYKKDVFAGVSLSGVVAIEMKRPSLKRGKSAL
jgi:hypothetical protein